MLKRIIDNEFRLLSLVGIVAVVVLLRIAVTFNINWDEFNYLAQIYAYLSGTLAEPLQTMHVHVFTWLPSVSANEANQIVAARLVMLLLHGLTAFFVYRIAARATDRRSGLFATLAYLSLSYVIRGGASFRYDPIAITLISAAIDFVVFRKPDPCRAATGGALMGAAALVTIKTAIFLPSFLFVVALPLIGERRTAPAVGSLVAAVLAMVAAFSGLYMLHALSLAPAGATAAMVGAVFHKTLWEAGFFPRFAVFLRTFRLDFGIWAFLLAGMVLTLVKIRHSRGEARQKWLALAALGAPLASLFVYRNAFPYFYGFLLAPPAVLIAVAWQALGSYSQIGNGAFVPQVIKLLAILHLLLNLVFQGVLTPLAQPLVHQRQILQVVHRMFAEPVLFFSRSAFVASFPVAGFFMSTWGMDNYQAIGERVFARAIVERAPPLLIADHPLLDLENQVYPPPLTEHRHKLFEEDRAALKATYIHHWGPIYVAGLRASIKGHKTVEIMIGGRYTLEADGPIEIDGRRLVPGESMVLSRGAHGLIAGAGPADITLRWGEKLYRPEDLPPALPLFLGF